MSEEYDLEKSSKGLGKLCPILKDKHGNIIDGFHRQNTDPDWPSVTVESVDSDQKLELARLATNFCRRTLKGIEFENRLRFLVGKCGMKPEEISEATGISVSTIYRYLPQEFKDQKKVDAGKVSGSVRTCEQTVKTQDIPIRPNGLVECEIGMHLVDPSKARNVHGHVICETHEEVAKMRFAPQKPTMEVKEYKPKETWEHRKAQMSPQHSKMEETILNKLIEHGVKPVITDRSFCLTQTTPDLFLPDRNLAVYLDGKDVHQNRTDRDEQLRELLTKRHGVRVLSITYDGNGSKEVERILKQIEEA